MPGVGGGGKPVMDKNPMPSRGSRNTPSPLKKPGYKLRPGGPLGSNADFTLPYLYLSKMKLEFTQRS